MNILSISNMSCSAAQSRIYHLLYGQVCKVAAYLKDQEGSVCGCERNPTPSPFQDLPTPENAKTSPTTI